MSSLFGEEVVAFGTRHAKGPMVEPVLARCGLRVLEVPINTDRLGTFTPEQPRRHDEVRTAAIKAARASRRLRTRLGLGSEGTFRPHPAVPALSIDVETLVLRDRRTKTLVVEREVATTEVPRQVQIDSDHPLDAFLEQVGFPAQGIVISVPGSRGSQIKGIADLQALEAAIARLGTGSGPDGLLATTDLRAHLCPARRLVIERCAERLSERLATPCPRCHEPGFGVAAAKPGLACSQCSTPTSRASALELACPWCLHKELQRLPGEADPSECSRCNP